MPRSRGLAACFERIEHLALSHQTVLDVEAQDRLRLLDQAAVGGKEPGGLEYGHLSKRLEVEEHVPIGRLDDDGADRGNHVAGDHDVARLVDEAQMPGGVARGVKRGQGRRSRTVELDAFAVLNRAVDIDDAVEALGGHGVSPKRKLEALP